MKVSDCGFCSFLGFVVVFGSDFEDEDSMDSFLDFFLLVVFGKRRRRGNLFKELV